MIRSLLIANRGEIACRVIRTAKRLGVSTVAVYSEADAGALHVAMADRAVAIGPSAARHSYLDGTKIIAAALETGAEAIHPGYGFLSENADFAEAVAAAGLVWIGPDASSIRAMGLKDAAKELMGLAGVPTTPGYLGDDQNPERLRREALVLGYPVLIKAVAGGGGKGMRRVDSADDFAAALQSCKREAASSFGNDRVLLERYIARPRHIEVQVFGDRHGNVVHLFERDCSLQRRHQKVIEEAPAPGMDHATREAICAAAVKAARAVAYVGAGTIEFIADASEGLRPDRVWFMEMNTRLQVEHPVTEEVTGQDLVEWQIRVASGEPLPLEQHELRMDGWAMEARLYAEDPTTGFLPSTGRLERFRTDGVRLEAGVRQGDTVSPHYDPMIAKLVSRGVTRGEAASRLLRAVRSTVVWPVKTNAAFLGRALSHRGFLAGDVDTGFIERNAADLIPAAEPPPAVLHAAGAAMVATLARGQTPAPLGFRLNRQTHRKVCFRLDGIPRSVELQPDALTDVGVEDVGYGLLLHHEGAVFFATPERREAGDATASSDGAVLSPMPGRVTALHVEDGQAVSKGHALATVEAMKMEHTLASPFDGTVTDLKVHLDAQVTEGSCLMRVKRISP